MTAFRGLYTKRCSIDYVIEGSGCELMFHNLMKLILPLYRAFQENHHLMEILTLTGFKFYQRCPLSKVVTFSANTQREFLCSTEYGRSRKMVRSKSFTILFLSPPPSNKLPNPNQLNLVGAAFKKKNFIFSL